MALSIDSAIQNLRGPCEQMLTDGRRFGSIAYIGGTPRELGLFFSDRFECDCLPLPSCGFAREFGNSVKMANVIYRHFPEAFRRPVSWAYRGLKLLHRTSYPTYFLLGDGWHQSRLPVLLVDDSSHSGETFEYWKGRIKRELGRDTTTVSITAIGNYRPDYYFSRKWCSFEWRPVGV